MNIFESSKIPLITLWVMLGLIQIGIFVISVLSMVLLTDRIESVSYYQGVFFRNPNSFKVNPYETNVPYQSIEVDEECPTSFEAPLAYMSMNLLHYMHLKGDYAYKNHEKTYNLNTSDYIFSCSSCLLIE